MFAAAILTKSLGALVAGGVGVAVWVIIGAFSGWIAAHRTKAIVIAWCFAGAGLLAVVAHGLYHQSLPGQSLNFRWQYWRASAGLIADHALTGVGRENFGRHYLEYKSIESPEEVANPHNLFVQAAADWGMVGLAGLVVMLVGASRAVTRPRPPRPATATRASEPSTPGRMLFWLAALAAVVVLGRLPLLGSSDVNFLYVATVMTGVPWVIGFVCCATGGIAPTREDQSRGAVVSTAVAIGLLAFVLHEMINFAAFVPGTAVTCFALLAYCISERPFAAHKGRRYKDGRLREPDAGSSSGSNAAPRSESNAAPRSESNVAPRSESDVAPRLVRGALTKSLSPLSVKGTAHAGWA
ncbi:unnamed protein product, partial [marine sediment metagenome]